ncbi:MAG TPA: hypothetical protein VIG26_01430, partial [Methyloceanibacter sp.]
MTGAIARGGAERQMIALTDGLLNNGFQVEVFELQGIVPGQASFADELIARGVKSRRANDDDEFAAIDDCGLGPFASLLPTNIARICAAFAQAISEFQPRVVHGWSDFSNVVGGFVATKMGVERIVLAQRAFPPPFWYDAPHAEFYREAYLSLCANPAVVLLNNSAAS